MPEPETLTPSDGTATSPTPGPGTETPPLADQGTEQESPVVTRYKEQLNGAQQEALRQRDEARRLYQQNQILTAELQRRQQQPAAELPSAKPARITVQQYNDAIVEGRHDIQEAFLAQERHAAVEEATNTLRQESQQRENYQRRAGNFSSLMRSTPGLADPKSGLMQEAVNEYQGILADPFIDPEAKQPNLQLIAPDPNTGNPGLWINDTLFRQAVKLAETRRINSKAAAAEEVRTSQDNFIEPSGKGAGAPPGQQAHGNKIFLTEREKAEVRKIQKRDPNYSEAQRWKYMDPEIKARRTRAGRAE